MRIFACIILVAVFAVGTLGQEAGNRNFSRNGVQRTPPNTGVIGNGTDQMIEAYVLLNAAPDEFVVVFGVAQEAPTAAESNQKVNAQIEQLLSAADKLGINRSSTFVDFITQNRIYDFVPSANNTIRETISGFQTKKTVALRYKERAILEKLLAAAAQASIFDLIKVDYALNDMGKIHNRLFEEAVRIVKQKEETYARSLGLAIRRHSIIQETYNTYYPAELYESYTAYESGTVDPNYESNTRVVRERKSSTSFLEPLDRSAFDAVVNPVDIEPRVQCTLYLKIKYTVAP
jgi:uncharacterized protein YggE